MGERARDPSGRRLEARLRRLAGKAIPCNLCGSQTGLERVKVKEMLAAWERESPGRVKQIFRALGNVSPSQLADPALFDFASLRSEPAPGPETGFARISGRGV